jgi:hypothetical protein
MEVTGNLQHHGRFGPTDGSLLRPWIRTGTVEEKNNVLEQTQTFKNSKNWSGTFEDKNNALELAQTFKK